MTDNKPVELNEIAESKPGYALREGSKIRYDLIPPEFISELALLMTIGSIKYKPRNCEVGFELDELIRAIYSHTTALQSGQIDDPETKVFHSTCIAWNALMISMQFIRAPGVMVNSIADTSHRQADCLKNGTAVDWTKYKRTNEQKIKQYKEIYDIK